MAGRAEREEGEGKKSQRERRAASGAGREARERSRSSSTDWGRVTRRVNGEGKKTEKKPRRGEKDLDLYALQGGPREEEGGELPKTMRGRMMQRGLFI